MAPSVTLPFRHRHRGRFGLDRLTTRRSRSRSAGRLAGEVALGAATLALGGFALYFLKERSQEEAEHHTLERDGSFSLRRYSPRIVAEVRRSGRLIEAMDDGFRSLSGYISAQPGSRAANQTNDRIAMAIPVSVAPAEDQAGEWRVRFTLPRSWQRQKLPEPSEGVELIQLPARTLAAVRFGGKGSDTKLIERHRDALLSWVRGRGLVALSEPEFAAYNAPVVPGLLRRNEWWVEIDDADVRTGSNATLKVHKSL